MFDASRGDRERDTDVYTNETRFFMYLFSTPYSPLCVGCPAPGRCQ
jgi:hypothetical protein